MIKANKKLLLTLISISAFTGCSSSPKYHWVGKTAPQDAHQCTIQAAKLYPVALYQTQIGYGYTSPVYTHCNPSYGGSVNCNSFGGGYTPPVQVTSDANQNNRENFFYNCMIQKGNNFVPIGASITPVMTHKYKIN